MELERLVELLPSRKGAIHTFSKAGAKRHSFAALADDVAAAKAKLTRWGVQAGMRVGIYAPNGYDWVVYDLALISLRAISVAFTDDFAGRLDEAVLDKYDIALLLITGKDAALFPQRPAHVALMDGENTSVRALARDPVLSGDEDDHHSLVFSSGSAGGLKGLIVSRKGITAMLPPLIQASIDPRPGDRLLLFLPMSNFQQRNMCYAALWHDFDIIITDYTQLFAAMAALQPTILIAPPIFYEMVQKDFERFPDWKKSLWLGMGRVLSVLPEGLGMSLGRRLFSDFHAKFGGKMRLLVTGMAPVRANIALLFQRMQLPLCESYGMMEAGAITYRPAHSRKYGSVGKLLPDVNVSTAEDGEIVVHRPHLLTLRYFQCAEGENERTFLGGGRVATGDIGRLDEDGDLYLLGRKKELLITPGGYKVHPELIEKDLNDSPDVAHSVIFMRRDGAGLACVVDLFPGRGDAGRERVRKYVINLDSVKRAGAYVDVIIADEPFTTANGMLRPNMKIDRRAVIKRYNP